MKILQTLRTTLAQGAPIWFSFLIGIVLFLCPKDAFTQGKRSNDPELDRTSLNRQMEDENFSEERAIFRYRQRTNENGEIPFGALMRAKTEVDAMRARASAKIKSRSPQDAGIVNWEWLGPGNIGGRIRTILISPDNPSIMWIGSVSGGIWRTDNGGNVSWSPVDDFMANLAVTSLVMDPTDHNVMYASTGEGSYSAHNPPVGLQGAGIFKSINGGVTWSQLPSTNNSAFLFVRRLAHHPSAANTSIAAVGNSVRETTDGGASWSILLPNATYPTIGQVYDLAYDPTNGNRILVGDFGGRVFYSTTGGGGLTEQTTDSPKLPADSTKDCAVAFAKSNSNMYVSMNRYSGQVYRSTDNGATWDLMNNGSNYISQGNTNTIWVDPTDPNTIVVGGLDVWRSRDGGTNLAHISAWPCYQDCGGIVHSAHADQHIIVAHPAFDGINNKVVYVGNDGGIQYTAYIYAAGIGGQGDGWTHLAHNLGITQFYGGAASPDGSLIIGGSQDNNILRYTGGPNTWFQHNSGDGGFCAIDYLNTDFRYGEYVFLEITRQGQNTGNFYITKISGLTDAQKSRYALFIAPFSIDPNDPTILVAGGTSIWRTTNRADLWSRIRDSLGTPGPKCSAIDIQNGNSSVIWVGYTNGTVSRTTDAGASWTNVDGGFTPLPDRYVTDIAINPFDGNEVFVTFGGYNSDEVWRTVDFGTSWSQRTGSGDNALPALQVNTVRFHPLNPNWVYIGTDLGVFASEDKGLNWNVTSLYGINEGPANVEVDELFWQGSEYLIAATHGRGMFRTRILSNVYVDINNNGFQDGTQQYPYHQIQDAINTAGIGSSIIINPGDYVQPPLTFYKRGKVIAPAGNVIIH